MDPFHFTWSEIYRKNNIKNKVANEILNQTFTNEEDEPIFLDFENNNLNFKFCINNSKQSPK